MAHIAGNIFTGRCWMTCRQIANSCTVHSSIGFGADTLNCISLMCTIQEIVNLVFQIGWFSLQKRDFFCILCWTVHLHNFSLVRSSEKLKLKMFPFSTLTASVSSLNRQKYFVNRQKFAEFPRLYSPFKGLLAKIWKRFQTYPVLKNFQFFSSKLFPLLLMWCDDNDNNADDDTDDGYV